jgi:hypothetical protein
MNTTTSTTGRFITIEKHGRKHTSYQGSTKWRELNNLLTVKPKNAIVANPCSKHTEFIAPDILPVDSLEAYSVVKDIRRFNFANTILKSLVRRGPKYKNFD